MTSSSATITTIDNSKERSGFGFPVAAITAANHDAQYTAIGVVQTAVAAMTLAAVASRNVTQENVQFPYVVPSDVYANRESGVTFTLEGTTTSKNRVRVTLPAPDLSKFPFVALQDDIAQIPFAGLHADLIYLISALEAAVVHPVSNEAMIVVRMEKIGRNL